MNKKNNFFTTQTEIETWLHDNKIINYTIHSDLTVSVHTDVIIEKKMNHFPIQFNKINGTFDCSYNELISLEGTPKSIDGTFDCAYNSLKTLEGGPAEIGGYYDCSHNKLISLYGVAQSIHLHLYCSHNKIQNLNGINTILGNLNCENNPLIKLSYLEIQNIEIKENIYLPSNFNNIIKNNLKNYEDFNDCIGCSFLDLKEILKINHEKAQLENMLHSSVQSVNKKLKI